MNFVDFKKSLSEANPPNDLSAYLLSMWHDAKGDWNKAHEIIQDVEDKTASWIHAYLHRKEGDVGNADYWYSKAGKQRPNLSLEEEWKDISEALMNKH
jgi:hypothetical protein